MIKEIILKKNIVMVNRHHERGYLSKTGVIIIEEDSGKKHILDLESNNDISESDYIDIIDRPRTKVITLFKNIMFDAELLERYSRGE